MNPSTFQIYDASAGSGKTYSLVKEYLKLLFCSPYREPYKHILAITFTNKAVTEMKERIISNLRVFASPEVLVVPSDMFSSLCDELSMRPEQLNQSAKLMLQSIVHNYAAFDVSTIDKFTQKLIRTFAYDLKLPINFEVELNTDEILSQAIDNLIAKAGSDKGLTKLLVDFALEKADDDKSYNIEGDFMPIAKLITNEGNTKYLEKLRDKDIKAFNELNSSLIKNIGAIENTIKKESKIVLDFIEECGLQANDFTGGYLLKHFSKLSQGMFNVNLSTKWQENIDSERLYPTRVTDDIASIIDEIQPQLSTAFHGTKSMLIQLKLLKAIYKNLTPLSVLNEINKEVEAIKQEDNILLISEFNSIVSEHIKTQPVPYIYERIGEKFKHYFIDEFQDTSVMQWENLIPLIQNALSSEGASAMLVGDAKQAIYRWRGGKAEQFIGLAHDNNPFSIEKKLQVLESNYRSAQQIIAFNNTFFSHLSTQTLHHELYKQLYENSQQNSIKTKEGYVNLTFLELNKDDNKNEEYPEQTLTTIKDCLENGFAPQDIAVLVRKNKEGVSIANYIIEHSDIDVVSSESLLLTNAPEVTFIVSLLKLSLDKHNKQLKVDILSYLAEHKLSIDDKHSFFYTLVNLDIVPFFKALELYGFYFNVFEAMQLPLYEAVEKIIHDFKLVETSNAYIQFFLDFVHEYIYSSASDVSEFIELYENKKDKLSIIASEETDAVRIMTIHKAKGLEFPVVIFPYANINIYDERNYKVWYELNPNEFNGFEYALINYNKDLQDFGEQGQELHNTHQHELELDNINILYVALTRAVEQLYIISEKTRSNTDVLKTFSDFFISYLKHINKWSDEQLSYDFGIRERTSEKTTDQSNALVQHRFISTPLKNLNISIASNTGYLWNTKLENAIEKGNLIHLIMAQIKTPLDIDFVFSNLERTGVIASSQRESLKAIVQNIVDHQDIQQYFSSINTIYTEKEILTATGNTLIPDRLILNSKNEMVILDYKTGEPKKSHIDQIKTYERVLTQMNFSIKKLVLVYINESIKVKEV